MSIEMPMPPPFAWLETCSNLLNMYYKISSGIGASTRCGIILAGGKGRRLRPFVEKLRGNMLPKQYVNFIGRRSMLEHTFHRAQKLIPAERLVTVVSERHLENVEVRRQLLRQPPGCVIAQPDNRETAPGLLLPLAHLNKLYPDSTVAVFPSDHFILEEDLFLGHVELACRAVEQGPSKVVLLGVEPREAEREPPLWRLRKRPGCGVREHHIVTGLRGFSCYTQHFSVRQLLATVARLRSGNSTVENRNGGAYGLAETNYCWP